MTRILAIAVVTALLGACSSMYGSNSTSMGNKAETKNSTDSNKADNKAAVSPAK